MISFPLAAVERDWCRLVRYFPHHHVMMCTSYNINDFPFSWIFNETHNQLLLPWPCHTYLARALTFFFSKINRVHLSVAFLLEIRFAALRLPPWANKAGNAPDEDASRRIFFEAAEREGHLEKIRHACHVSRVRNRDKLAEIFFYNSSHAELVKRK